MVYSIEVKQIDNGFTVSVFESDTGRDVTIYCKTLAKVNKAIKAAFARETETEKSKQVGTAVQPL